MQDPDIPSQPVLAFHSDIIAGIQQCVASKASGCGPLPTFPRPCVARQLADMRRTSVVGSQRS